MSGEYCSTITVLNEDKKRNGNLMSLTSSNSYDGSCFTFLIDGWFLQNNANYFTNIKIAIPEYFFSIKIARLQTNHYLYAKE